MLSQPPPALLTAGRGQVTSLQEHFGANRDCNTPGQNRASITYFRQTPHRTSGAEGSVTTCTKPYRFVQLSTHFIRSGSWSICQTQEVCVCPSVTLHSLDEHLPYSIEEQQLTSFSPCLTADAPI